MTDMRSNGQGLNLVDSVYERLLAERIIFLGSQVDDDIANKLCAQILLLSAEDPTKDIHLYINSPGGSISAGMAIYDTMQYIRPDVATVCVGQAASMAAVLLAGGAKGKRSVLPNSRVLIHQPLLFGLQGQATEIEIHARELLRMRDRLDEILAFHTGKPVEQIHLDTERDKIFGADDSVKYGLADQVMVRRVPGAVGGPTTT